MKLREPNGRKGGRSGLMRAADVIGRPEVEEASKFKWVEVTEQTELINKLLAVLEFTKESATEDGEEKEDLHKNRLKLAYFLSALCRKNPKLFTLSPKDLKNIVDQRSNDGDFEGDPHDWLAGKFNNLARLGLEAVDLGADLKDAVDNVDIQIDILFTVAIGTPKILKKNRGILTRALPAYIESIQKQTLLFAVIQVAKLILLYPEKRGELLGQLSQASVIAFKRMLVEMEGKLQHADAGEITSSDAEFTAQLLFFRQVLAAEGGEILPNGDVELIPPKKHIQSRTPLPDRVL